MVCVGLDTQIDAEIIPKDARVADQYTDTWVTTSYVLAALGIVSVYDSYHLSCKSFSSNDETINSDAVNHIITKGLFQ